MEQPYWIIDNVIIFKPEFNSNLDETILEQKIF